MTKICFLGAGRMGIGMATRLVKSGHIVQVYNRTKEKLQPLVDQGAKACETPKQTAEGAEVLISMVGDDIASQSVWLGDSGALSANLPAQALVIECSTLSHDWAIKLSTLVKKMNMQYLDAPVTGLPDAAANGELTFFLGGDEKTINKAQPYIKPLSSSQIHFGEIGTGTAYKLIANLMGSIQIAATAEGLLVAEKMGLDLNKVATTLALGAAGSPNVTRNSMLMANSNHEENILFNAFWRAKDTRYAVELAEKVGQDVPLGKVAKNLFEKLIKAGYSQLAESKIIDILRDK